MDKNIEKLEKHFRRQIDVAHFLKIPFSTYRDWREKSAVLHDYKKEYLRLKAQEICEE